MLDAVKMVGGETYNPLWDYSLMSYKRAGVETICLTLQDEFNLNVNFLLYCCWLSTGAIKIADSELLQQVKELRYWDHEVLMPLRQARRALVNLRITETEALKDKVKLCELEAERLFQNEMYSSFVQLNKKPETAQAMSKKKLGLSSISNKKDLSASDDVDVALRNAHFAEIALHNLECYTSIFHKVQTNVLKKNLLTLVGLLEE
jgi:uncharacterized protein (TIGR02444 family)